VSVTEHLPLLVTYEKRTCIALALFIIVFAGDDQALEDLLPEGLKPCNRTSHIFIPVQATHNGVDFELDAEVSTLTGNFRQLLHVLSTPASSDLDICLWVERIAGYSEDVNERGVLAQELLSDL
jgi:hypothetical protein